MLCATFGLEAKAAYVADVESKRVHLNHILLGAVLPRKCTCGTCKASAKNA